MPPRRFPIVLETSRNVAAVLTAVVLIACSPSDNDAEARGEAPSKSRFPILQEVKVEVREDGLAYLPGAATPFTGDAIELHYDRTPPRLAMRTPYRDGKKDGMVVTCTSGGKLRQERTYREGRPVSSLVYHPNGQKKIEVGLNERDLAEGAFRRWHDNGVLEAEATFDADERFHGEGKDYDREGKLVGHYRKVHGKLVEVLFETPETKAERVAKWGPAVPGDEVPPSAPVKP
jgi:hypothetical protein